MEQVKKNKAEEINKRAIELFGMTPDEISTQNEEWMIKKGYKKSSLNGSMYKSDTPKKKTRLNEILRRLRL